MGKKEPLVVFGDEFADLLGRSLPRFRADYSDRIAFIMASLCKAAYFRFEKDPEEMRELDEAVARGGFELVGTFYLPPESGQNGDTEAILVKNENFAVLAFRGTAGLNDLMSDLRFFKKRANQTRNLDNKGLEIHSGFFEAYACLHDSITEACKEVEGMPLYFTGHSLGGALAVIAGAFSTHDNVAAVYTFGSPRVGNRNFRKLHLKTPVYRVENFLDIITIVPFSLFKFRHVGRLIYLSRRGFRKEPALTTLHSFKRMLLIWVALLLPPLAAFRDHRMDRYIRKLAPIALRRRSLKWDIGAFLDDLGGH